MHRLETKGRARALQILYAWELTGEGAEGLAVGAPEDEQVAAMLAGGPRSEAERAAVGWEASQGSDCYRPEERTRSSGFISISRASETDALI